MGERPETREGRRKRIRERVRDQLTEKNEIEMSVWGGGEIIS